MQHKIIYKSIVGSKAYGTAVSTSDDDYKGVYVQHPNEILSFKYKEQIDVSKEECYYEVRRFLQLLQSANPTMLELLFMPDECVIEKHEAFVLIQNHKEKFLTKKCLHSFGGYALQQIKKASGLDKKMNWEKEKMVRKTPFDFCYVYEDGKTINLNDFLLKKNFEEKKCGLVALNHFKDAYSLYYDFAGSLNYKGIANDDSNELRLTSVGKEEKAQAIIYYNKDGYTMHCKDFNQYNEWMTNRNTSRYVDVENHQQQIDGKNMLHCRRLMDMALEIATTSTFNVKRPNANELIKIRKGEVDLQTIIQQTEEDLQKLNDYFKNSSLPDEVDFDFVNKLLLEVRNTIKF
jgi:uncharacterized protein